MTTALTEPRPPADPPTVLMLTDHPELVDVRHLAKRGAAPTLWSVVVHSQGGMLRGILATEAQMVELRDLLDSAIDRARHIDRQERNRR